MIAIKTNIFIPKKINVGFQERSDTYTKKLAYIIYFDEKGKLRKEASWEGWRDKKIENIICDNIPTSGFVLNKKAGGYDTGWNHRQTYCRVYDPRDFEFEITIPNLLYILENTNSIKGKGLEGQFVYGWDGKDLLLIPTASPDYIKISQFNEKLHKKEYVKSKDLKLGATYKTKDNEEWIYMGRFDYWKTKSERIDIPPTSSKYDRYYSSRNFEYVTRDINKGKHYFFVKDSNDYYGKAYLSKLIVKSLGDKFIETVSEECVENYADLFDRLEYTTDYSPLDKTKDEYVPYTFDEFCEKFKNKSWFYCYNSQKKEYEVSKVYNTSDKCYYHDRENHYSSNRIEGTYIEIYNRLQPTYKNQYLKNGKLYRKGN